MADRGSVSPHGIPAEVGIKALGAGGLAGLVAEFGEPTFRARQLSRWLYSHHARSYDEMTDVPAALRSKLTETAPLYSASVVDRQTSSDGTRKYLLSLADGETVEAVGLPTRDRLTVCFSTQVGCAMGCAFCATGQGGFVRDLGPGEMVDQIAVISGDFGARVTNAVAMGQGEPFANYDRTLDALRFMNSSDGVGIGARHLTVSTCGILPGLRRFAAEPEQFTLAVSLHSAVQATRDSLMPGVRGHVLSELRSTLVDYSDRTGRRPSLEYALIEGVNDTPDELAALITFCSGLLVHVNLIPANPTALGVFGQTKSTQASAFADKLAAAGISTTIRTERGADIDAACGQLKQRSKS